MFLQVGLILLGLLLSFPISIQPFHVPPPAPKNGMIIRPSMFSPIESDETKWATSRASTNGTKWAVLVAGSNGYENYRHQSDVCHAYQILRRAGMKDENIIVFMYDDIAFDENNPQPGVIINRPQGPNVYKGVPKDYTGNQVTKENLYAVLLGNKSALKGGSGKVLKSGPNDHVFIFYSDHGSPGVIGMPQGGYIYAHELNQVMKKMHAKKSYKTLVFYLEACEGGSMLDGLLPEGMNIYATTATNTTHDSYAHYCPEDIFNSLHDYTTCLGDLYSISWMEDCDNHDLRIRTLKNQYEAVKKRTKSKGTVEDPGSNVMQYGKLKINMDTLSTYMGSKPFNRYHTTVNYSSSALSPSSTRNVNQRDADLLHFIYKLRNSPRGSSRWIEAEKRVLIEMKQRKHVDKSMSNIVQQLFGADKVKTILEGTRPQGQALADDWTCFKASVRAYEENCGALSNYGRKYTRTIANICNAGASIQQVAKAAAKACRMAGS
ncbi:vacuolar-processing enzyme-like [Impatiens glandulifera]|uniref:vacuolar-processing enzyme-like n=1 Tax=Impatiens glandulifera TaxID=253017 RepID=UPI001FB0E1AF|nr:vacuolar-processing enzyme-like [Impatiens glandulifera]